MWAPHVMAATRPPPSTPLAGKYPCRGAVDASIRRSRHRRARPSDGGGCSREPHICLPRRLRHHSPRRRLPRPKPLPSSSSRLLPLLLSFGTMAFANKLGSLLKKATSSNPSLYQAIRCMSSSKLFVGGISYNIDDHGLKEAFSNYGQVIEAKIILDRESGRSRGFGFVTYSSSEEASAAITAMDGKDLDGRNIRVNHATERTGGFRTGGGGFGGGGYGGGGGYSGGGGGYGGGGGGYGGNYGNRGGGGYGGGGDYGVAGGAGGNFAAGGSNNFASSNFGADSGFGGNPAGSFGAAGGSPAGDEFSTGAPGDNFDSGKNDDIMGDLFKDEEPENYANKRS